MNREYEGLTDEELIVRFREGETEIVDFIMEKYKNLVRSKAKSMFILGGDTQDLIQEGMIGLFKAIRDYDFGRDASFFTFADLCVARNMYTAVQKSGRKKHMPLNSYISIDGREGSKDDNREAGIIGGLIADESICNPEEILIGKETVALLEKSIERDLSPFERQVLELTMTGLGYAEIAKILGRDEKSADNALQRIRAKVKKCIAAERA